MSKHKKDWDRVDTSEKKHNRDSVLSDMMAGLRGIAVVFLLLLPIDAFYIYEPSHQPVEEIAAPTVGDLILEGFTFNGPNSAQNPLVTMPKLTIKKRAVPRRSVPVSSSSQYVGFCLIFI